MLGLQKHANTIFEDILSEKPLRLLGGRVFINIGKQIAKQICNLAFLQNQMKSYLEHHAIMDANDRTVKKR